MAPRRKCNVCGSQQWHKEPATGSVVCSEGHVLQNYLNETFETHEIGALRGRKRTLKSTRERQGRKSRANPELYHGARAQFLHYQCLQLLLRKQVAALVQLWEFPTEFEIICRDLWALYLSLLPSPPSPEPLLHEQATLGDVDDRDAEVIGVHGEKASPDRAGASSPEGDDIEGDSEIDEMLRALSESSSSEDEKDDDTGEPRLKPEGAGRKSRRFGCHGPTNNVALLMVACWTLRLPVMYLDLIRLIESYKLPYLEPLHHLPASMIRHLTKHNVQALSPPHAPTTLLLHRLSARLARKLLGSYRVHTPELNAAPMLWRVVRAVGGSPVLYDLAKTVAHVLSLPLALHHTLAPRLAHLKDDDPDSHKYDNVPPELALLVAVIIVLKMVYGLDGKLRVPNNSTDPACALPRIEDYFMIFKEVKEAHMRSKEVLFSATSDISVLNLDENMLDEYLELCQRGLLRPEMLRSGRDGRNSQMGQGTNPNWADQRTLEQFFPLESGRVGAGSGNRTGIEGPQGDQRVLRAGVAVEKGRMERDELEPGETYAIYRSRDVLGELPEDVESVMSYGARWVGVDEETVGRVSEGYERRLWSWWGRLRREEGIEARRWLR